MSTKSVSRKELKLLLKDKVSQSISQLELPQPNKKVKKLINRTARKMAAAYASLLKKEMKRSTRNGKVKHVDAVQVA